MSDARRFIDRHGFAWQVCELWSPTDRRPRLADLPLDTASGWLYFFSRGTTLVLRRYPSRWDELTPRELESLRDQAVVLGSDEPLRLAVAVHPVATSAGAVLGAMTAR